MKKLFAAIALICATSYAFAACPPGTIYNCIQMPNGKMSCGCR